MNYPLWVFYINKIETISLKFPDTNYYSWEDC